MAKHGWSWLHLILLLLLMWLCKMSVTAKNNNNSTCTLVLTPKSITRLTVAKFAWIHINCSCCHFAASFNDNVIIKKKKGVLKTTTTTQSIPSSNIPQTFANSLYHLLIFIETPNLKVATPSHHRESLFSKNLPKCPHVKEKRHSEDTELCSYVTIDSRQHTSAELGFYVESNQVGRVNFLLQVLQVSINISNAHTSKEIGDMLSSSPILGQILLPISTERRIRISDTAFEWTTAFIACILSLCMGCMTDLREVMPYLRRPRSLLTGLICQHILMPLLALGLVLALDLQKDCALGILLTTAVPGGGMAHLTVFLMKGDGALSATISLANSVLVLGLSPAWLALMAWFFNVFIHVAVFALWLTAPLIAHVTGAALRYLHPACAEAVLNWLTRPVLLLSAILMITLGVYINHYAFDYVDAKLMLSAAVLIGAGFMLGGIAGYLTKHTEPQRKALAAETSVSSCLIVMPAIRYAMESPTADLATIFPLWGCFFTPTPILLYFCAHKMKCVFREFIAKRREKQFRHYSIVSSLAKMAEEVTAVSVSAAPMVIDENINSCSDVIGNKSESTTRKGTIAHNKVLLVGNAIGEKNHDLILGNDCHKVTTL